MQYREFGKLGIKASAFGLGCMRFPMVETVDAQGNKHRQIDEEGCGHEFEQTSGDSAGQGSLACCTVLKVTKIQTRL